MNRTAHRTLVVAATAALSLSAIAIASSANADPSGGRGKADLSERRIVRIAMTAAARAGDSKPTLIQHSEGTRYRANLVASGDVSPGRTWSYLIAERGKFAFADAPRPPGARAPSGSVITLVVDASTGEITDAGVSNRYPDLGALGPVSTDLRHGLRRRP